MTAERAPLSPEEHARIAARIALFSDKPRSQVLAPFDLSEHEWDKLSAEWARTLAREIREQAGKPIPIENRYPLAGAYAKAYADAVREMRAEQGRSERDEDATVRIPPDSNKTDSFSVFNASNRAATEKI
ncbi:MAG: hypothetical protein IPK82_12850 [Polyangiaceae bacterium]|nr:hypothetical protein [Polyangiaceae bacterium]